VGVLVADGSDAALIDATVAAVRAAGASAKIVAKKIGGIVAADGHRVAVDGQLAGTPSVLFDAVAIVLSEEAAAAMADAPAAVAFVRDAYAHLKAIGVDQGGQVLLQRAGLQPDAGVVDIRDSDAFVGAARTRQWERERALG
jgi:catalase